MNTATRRKHATMFSDALQAGYKAAVEAVTPPQETVAFVDLATANAAASLEAWYNANQDVKELERTKRRSRKLIDTLKAGTYGGWILRWKASARQTPDLEAIAETYRRLGLGDVPMKNCANTLEVEPA